MSERKPRFSILHPSARPDKWREIYDHWIDNAARPENVEYILVADHRWGFREAEGFAETVNKIQMEAYRGAQLRVVWNEGRRCYVDSVNTAAAASTGEILIVIADDQYPCKDWDEELNNFIAGLGIEDGISSHDELAIHVPTDTPTELERRICVMPILTRAYYAHLGHEVFWHEYESMYADNDFFEHAEMDGVLHQAHYRVPVFPHRHPGFDKSVQKFENVNGATVLVMDDQYKAQNRAEAYELGNRILTERRSSRFGHDPSKFAKVTNVGPARECLFICLPGESFPMQWVDATFRMLFTLAQRYITAPAFGYSSSVFSTRQAMLDTMQRSTDWAAPGMPEKPDWVLWIDDDNLVRDDQVEMMLNDLRACPEAGMVVGWCWIPPGSYGPARPSVSYLEPGTWKTQPIKVEVLRHHARLNECIKSTEDFPIVSGFPICLMRYEALQACGPMPFRPADVGTHVPNWGLVHEDISLCYRMQAAGWDVLIDPRVEVPHLKLGAISGPETTPDPPEGAMLADPGDRIPEVVKQ